MHFSSSLRAISVSDLTLEERVGQLLMPCFEGEVANEAAKVLIQEVGVGGIIYYNWTNGLTSDEQVEALSSGLQALARANRQAIPLLLAVDQEGGRVARLRGKGFTSFPGNGEVGETGSCAKAREVAFSIGEELKRVGISMNLAPVVDVNSNPNNPVIGNRSFGASADMVAAFGEAALEGYRKAGIVATLKHFPGHGDVSVDSHCDLPLISKSLEELEAVELVPFRKLAGRANVIMTAHLLVPALDPKYCSTLSEKTLSYLRNEMGYKGVIISDSLTMDGVLKQVKNEVKEAALLALKAGCDILLFGGKRLLDREGFVELSPSEIREVHRFLVEAAREDRSLEEKINRAAERVLNLKLELKTPILQ